jgi:hypothetical protein
MTGGRQVTLRIGTWSDEGHWKNMGFWVLGVDWGLKKFRSACIVETGVVLEDRRELWSRSLQNIRASESLRENEGNSV